MAESNATERYEICIRQHSRTCTCGIDTPSQLEYCGYCGGRGSHLAVCCRPPALTAPAAPLISQEVLDGVTVAGARAFWHAKDIEAKHEALRADVMTVVSDPHLTWELARQALRAALSK